MLQRRFVWFYTVAHKRYQQRILGKALGRTHVAIRQVLNKLRAIYTELDKHGTPSSESAWDVFKPSMYGNSQSQVVPPVPSPVLTAANHAIPQSMGPSPQSTTKVQPRTKKPRKTKSEMEQAPSSSRTSTSHSISPVPANVQKRNRKPRQTTPEKNQIRAEHLEKELGKADREVAQTAYHECAPDPRVLSFREHLQTAYGGEFVPLSDV